MIRNNKKKQLTLAIAMVWLMLSLTAGVASGNGIVPLDVQPGASGDPPEGLSHSPGIQQNAEQLRPLEAGEAQSPGKQPFTVTQAQEGDCVVAFVNPYEMLYASQALAPGTLLAYPDFESKWEGHTFAYWYDVNQYSGEGKGIPEPFEFPGFITGDLTLMAYFVSQQAAEDREPAVAIYMYHSYTPLKEGDTISLWANLSGFDGMTLRLQWQRSPDGERWEDIPGRTGLNYNFSASLENLRYTIRLAVKVTSTADVLYGVLGSPVPYYRVWFADEDGTPLTDRALLVREGYPAIAPSGLGKAGKAFAGWVSEPAGVDPERVIAKANEITFRPRYAEAKAASFVVRYVIEGEAEPPSPHVEAFTVGEAYAVSVHAPEVPGFGAIPATLNEIGIMPEEGVTRVVAYLPQAKQESIPAIAAALGETTWGDVPAFAPPLMAPSAAMEGLPAPVSLDSGSVEIEQPFIAVYDGNAHLPGVKVSGQTPSEGGFTVAYSIGGSGPWGSGVTPPYCVEVVRNATSGAPEAVPVYVRVDQPGHGEWVSDAVYVTIMPATVTVSPMFAYKNYGEDDPVFRYTVVGTVPNGETPGFKGSLTHTGGEDVKRESNGALVTFPIVQGTLELNKGENGFDPKNYDLVVAAGGGLFIYPKTLKLEFTDAVSLTKVYGDTDPSFNLGADSYTLTGLLDGDGDPVLDPAGTFVRFEGEDARPYTFKSWPALMDGPGFKAGNYSMTMPQNFQITRATLTVTPRSGQGKDCGTLLNAGDEPPYTFDVSGEKFGQKAVLEYDFSGGLTRDAGETPDAYRIRKGSLALIVPVESPFGGGSSTNHEGSNALIPKNYILSVNETVDYTVRKLNLPSLQLTAYKGIYDGAAHGPAVTDAGWPAGSEIWYSVTGGSGASEWSKTPPWKDATEGTATAYVKVTCPNHHDATGTSTVTITPVEVTLSVGKHTLDYTGAAPNLSSLPQEITATPALPSGHVVSGSLTLTAGDTGVAIGDHTLTLSEGAKILYGGVETKNYAIKSVVPGTLTIRGWTIAASVVGMGIILPNGTASVAPGGSITFSYAPVGGYRIKSVEINGVSNGTAAANMSYTFTNVTNNQTIKVTFEEEPAPPTASPSPSPVPTATATASPSPSPSPSPVPTATASPTVTSSPSPSPSPVPTTTAPPTATPTRTPIPTTAAPPTATPTSSPVPPATKPPTATPTQPPVPPTTMPPPTQTPSPPPPTTVSPTATPAQTTVPPAGAVPTQPAESVGGGANDGSATPAPVEGKYVSEEEPDSDGWLRAAVGPGEVRVALGRASNLAMELDQASNGLAAAFEYDAGWTEGLNITFTAEALGELIAAGVKEVTVHAGVFRFSFDQKAVAALMEQSGGTDVMITLTPAEPLSMEAAALIGTRPAYILSVQYEADGELLDIVDLGDGLATLGIAYDRPQAEPADKIKAVSIDEDGRMETLEESVHDEGWLTWTDNRCAGLFGVAYQGAE